jgi:hypothetical protein
MFFFSFEKNIVFLNTNLALKTLKMFLMPPLCGGAAKPPRLVLNGFSAALQAALVSKADEH